MEENHISWEILLKRARRTLSAEEEAIFQKWLAKDVRRQDYYERMYQVWSSDKTTDDLDTDVSKMISRFDEYVRKEQRVRFRKIKNAMYRIAACLLILVAIGGGIMLWHKEKTQTNTEIHTAHSILPGKDKAIILLSNGEKLDIDLLADSLQYQTSEFAIEKDSGIIKYRDQPKAEPTYNTIIIPKGGEYQVILSDGTRVWLNSESELKIPTSFTGNERRVFLSGEAYFDVIKNVRKPFIVETDLGNVKVYGTEFNVKRYANESQLKATLVKGIIGFSNKDIAELKLQPGYQLNLVAGERNPQIKQVKIYNEIAWKNKQFCFENKTLEAIARDLERWYNVEIIFSDPTLKYLEFSGTLSRYGEIETILRFFEESVNVKFVIDQQVITVVSK